MARPQGIDVELVEAARAGNTLARERLLSMLQPILRSFFIQRIGERAEVDDLVQNSLLRVHGGLSDLKEVDRLKGFAMKAALFELQDLYRGRYGSKERLFDPEFPPEHASSEDGPGARMDLERALATLSPKARRILELREYGYHYDEIAEMIDSTEAAIKMQVKRAFERLREVLVGLLLFLVAQGAQG